MLLGGLWHGSSWMFIIWGGLNGLGLMVHKGWERISPFKSNNTIAYRAFAIFLTLVFISFTRIWFRSDSLETVGVIFDRISYHFGGELFFKIISGYWFVLLVILLGYIIHWIPESIKINYRNWFSNLSYPKMIFTTVLIVFIIYQLVSSEMQPFIYFQFWTGVEKVGRVCKRWKGLLRRKIYRVSIRLLFFIFWLLFFIYPSSIRSYFFWVDNPINACPATDGFFIFCSLFDIKKFSGVKKCFKLRRPPNP